MQAIIKPKWRKTPLFTIIKPHDLLPINNQWCSTPWSKGSQNLYVNTRN